MNSEVITYEFGVQRSRYSLQADNKLVAYAAMCYHYATQFFEIKIFSPDVPKTDQWRDFPKQAMDKICSLYGGPEAHNKFIGDHIQDIRACMSTIKRIW